MKRNEIMSKINEYMDMLDNEQSENLEYDINSIIDDIENRLSNIKEKLEITSVADISDITDAYDLVSDLCADLY